MTDFNAVCEVKGLNITDVADYLDYPDVVVDDYYIATR